MTTVLVFGEVLFDCFSEENQLLGGAPFNIAWHLQALGAHPKLISRIGSDSDGQRITKAMEQWQMDTSLLQIDPQEATGRVNVTIKNQEPEYEIVYPCAYDFIAPPKLESLAGEVVLYHGTLALRHQDSEQALNSIISSVQPAIFYDVNLRNPWWNKDLVMSHIEHARWVKVNIDELKLLFPFAFQLEQAALEFCRLYQLELLIVTCGAAGVVIADPHGLVLQKPAPSAKQFVDTVGAGDAFSACFIDGLLRKLALEDNAIRALNFAAQVVGIQGATSQDLAFYQPFILEKGTANV